MSVLTEGRQDVPDAPFNSKEFDPRYEDRETYLAGERFVSPIGSRIAIQPNFKGVETAAAPGDSAVVEAGERFAAQPEQAPMEPPTPVEHVDVA